MSSDDEALRAMIRAERSRRDHHGFGRVGVAEVAVHGRILPPPPGLYKRVGKGPKTGGGGRYALGPASARTASWKRKTQRRQPALLQARAHMPRSPAVKDTATA